MMSIKTKYTQGSDAATLAATDAKNYEEQLAGSSNSMVVVTAAGVAAGAAVASTLISAVSTGSQLASDEQVKNDSNDFLQISIKNLSFSYSVIPYEFEPSDIDISELPGVVLPNTSDIILLTRQKDSFKIGSTCFSTSFLVNGAQLNLTFSLTDTGSPSRWKTNASVTGEDSNGSWDGSLQLKGLNSTGDSPFSLYTNLAETSSGVLELTFFDYLQ